MEDMHECFATFGFDYWTAYLAAYYFAVATITSIGCVAVRGNSTWQQYVATVRGNSTWQQYVATVRGDSTW